ncbi:ATP-binding protein [Hymenobacter latericus]|uniref:ATP-binding protein n=1 Tax=Hymenobacter sp. YIM 151858-1 TaxID=2987688 RepID=UPI00222611C8|nr:ATP-binding protein [Hymenobacter sp. YIM 151858-1]UYZ57822.1 PAS domain-containing protein [Hymenobacter sp. YIM 151858-1]
MELRARIPDQNPNPILQVDAAGQFLYSNPAGWKLWNSLTIDEKRYVSGRLREMTREVLREQQLVQQEVEALGRQYTLHGSPVQPEGYVNLYFIDVTERRRAEQQLAQEQRFYSNILDELPVEVVTLDADRRYIYANPQAVPSAEARQWLIGRTVKEYCEQFGYPIELAEHRHRMFDRAVAEREVVVWEDQTPTENGRTFHNRFFKAIAHPDGAFYMMLGFGLDNTAQREAELQLAQQREFYESILRHLPADVAVLDAEHRYMFANPGAIKNPEVRRWIIGKTDFDYCAYRGRPEQVAASRWQLFEQAKATGERVAFEEQLVKPNGQLEYAQRHYQPVYDHSGQLQMMIGYGSDTTEQRVAEEKLRLSEAELREQQAFVQQVLDTSPSLIYVRSADGNVQFSNRAMRQLTESSQDRLALTQDPTTVQAQEQAHYAAADQYVLQTGEELMREDSFTLPSGEVRWFQTIKRPLLRPDGSVQVLGVSTDITDLKRATEAAHAAARARENFLANMSHEIRTPLNGVLGYANLLAKTQLDAQQTEQLNVIRKSGQHLLALVNDVLDMAKITSGKMEFEQTPFNLCDSMGGAVQGLALQAAQKGLTFLAQPLRLTCPYPWVIGDPHRLNQILINLVANAVKFTQRGSVSVAGRLLTETDETLTVEFSVSDTGPGIPPDRLERIFEDFTQAYADTTRNFGGTGLGLSISRALVEQLGGTMRVESEMGRGSTFAFTVTLPKTRMVTPPVAEPAAPAATTALAGKRVLLVEDNEINRNIARMLLEEWNVVVDEAADGFEALALFEQNRYDAVLMDIQMPGMNGMEATAAIRANADAAKAQVPVLALTANAFRSDNERYLAAGMNDTLAKPFDEAELYQKLETLVKRPQRSYDLTRLREMARGKETFVHRIIQSFLENMPGSVAQIEAAAAAADWVAVAGLVHHIKPSLSSLGVQQVDEAVRLLEAARHTTLLSAHDQKTYHDAVQHLVAVVARVLSELPAELPAA